MARGDLTYAKCCVDWPLDDRLCALGDGRYKWINHCLWLLCVKERREVLTAEQSRPAYVARISGESVATVKKALSRMAALSRPLVHIHADGRIEVVGVREAHPAIKTWKPRPDAVQVPHSSPERSPNGERMGNERGENGSTTERPRVREYESRKPTVVGSAVSRLLTPDVPRSAAERYALLPALSGATGWHDRRLMTAFLIEAQRARNPSAWATGVLSRGPRWGPSQQALDEAARELGEKGGGMGETLSLGEALGGGIGR